MGDDLRVDMRRLSPSQQEALRMRVVAALDEGMSAAEAVRVFGVSENSIRNWKARYAFGGVAGLESRRPGRKAGVLRKLTPDQEMALVEAVVEFTPDQ
ncbi:helix-turn-helix domain-containing protein, partial [Nocardia sp. CNY236]|uniref:helix-turn-helix domain-containing protein n=1 Tax=Nocardia sp. CNY236 TaxID=1169152 RepID=UPI0018CAFAC5